MFTTNKEKIKLYYKCSLICSIFTTITIENKDNDDDDYTRPLLLDLLTSL